MRREVVCRHTRACEESCLFLPICVKPCAVLCAAQVGVGVGVLHYKQFTSYSLGTHRTAGYFWSSTTACYLPGLTSRRITGSHPLSQFSALPTWRTLEEQG